MKKSVAKYYGEDRMFDFEDFDRMNQRRVVKRRVVKRRARRRLRGQLAREMKSEMRACALI